MKFLIREQSQEFIFEGPNTKHLFQVVRTSLQKYKKLFVEKIDALQNGLPSKRLISWLSYRSAHSPAPPQNSHSIRQEGTSKALGHNSIFRRQSPVYIFKSVVHNSSSHCKLLLGNGFLRRGKNAGVYRQLTAFTRYSERASCGWRRNNTLWCLQSRHWGSLKSCWDGRYVIQTIFGMRIWEDGWW